MTGAIKQLPPNSRSLPNKIVLVGHEGCIDKLLSRKTIIKIVLRRSYRFHLVLVQVISQVFCGSKLIPVPTNQGWTLWRQVEFPHACNEVPSLFLDVLKEVRTSLYSWTNVEQTKEPQFII